jgi:hypothetical protein
LNALPSGSGPSDFQQPVRLGLAVGTRSMAPKRRASLKVMRAPALGVEDHMVMFLGRGVAWWKVAGRRARRPSQMIMRPDMPRWMISVSPVDRSARMYFDRRRSGPRARRSAARPSARGRASADRGGSPGARDHRALQHRGEAATDCLDFWKFGQGALSFDIGLSAGVTPRCGPSERSITRADQAGAQALMTDKTDTTDAGNHAFRVPDGG